MVHKRNEFFKAFTYKGLTFYGGPVADLAISAPWDFAINLSITTCPFMVIPTIPSEFSGFSKSLEQVNNTKLLNIPWGDFSCPKLPPSTWQALVSDLRKIKRADIAICCAAGIGRTGTTLAILHALLTGDTTDPVKKIRELYLGNQPANCLC